MNRLAVPAHTPMGQFPQLAGELLVGGIPLSRLAARAGQTPFYAYDRQLLTRRVDELRTALPPSVKLHYAMKANPMPALVCHMAALVDGIDVASAGELKVALDAGADPREISFAGPAKRRSELRQAVAAGILINVESFREVAELAEICAESGHVARLAVRVNPDFELKSAGMKMGGGARQFGVDAEQVPALLAAHRRTGTRLPRLPHLLRIAEPARRGHRRGARPDLRTGATVGSRSSFIRAVAEYRRRFRHSLLSGRHAARSDTHRR